MKIQSRRLCRVERRVPGEEVVATPQGHGGEIGQAVAVGAGGWLDSGYISWIETRGSANGSSVGCGPKNEPKGEFST